MLYGIVEFLGWFGAVTVLAGYMLFSTGKLQNGPAYQVLNLVGGSAIAVNVGAHHAIPSLIVNGIWSIVAVVVLTRMLRARRAAARGEPAAVTGPLVLVEPPTTTAVLPIVGPALRDHEDDAADPATIDAAADATAGPATAAAATGPVAADATAAQATADATDLANATGLAGAATGLPSDRTRAATVETGATVEVDATAPTDVVRATDAATGLRASTGADDAEAAPAPMTETLPVITATIALALVAAAQQEHALQERDQHDNDHDHGRDQHDNDHDQRDHAQQEHAQ